MFDERQVPVVQKLRGVIAMALGCATIVTSLALAPLESAAAADGDHATYLGLEHYTGEFHAHTSVSDGVGQPEDAFEHVHDETNADFFAVTEHDVTYDLRNGDDFIDDWKDSASDEWKYVHEAAYDYNKKQDKLVAVPAIENTWYDGTGHINLFDTDWKATARAQVDGSIDGMVNSFGIGDLKYDMYTYFARLKLDPDAIGQFNHPSSTGKGNFFDFNGLDPVVDDRMDLIEVKVASQVAQYQMALDKGWHVAPVYNGDEHQATWVSSAKPITGIWAEGHTLDDLYSAMRARSMYSTQEPDTVLGFSANGKLMGSILPADTASLDFNVVLNDPDEAMDFTSVQLIGNKGAVVHNFADVGGNDLTLDYTAPVAPGDFYYVKATQPSGSFVVSAPIWVGETTRGANYAPVITVPETVADHAAYGDTISLPAATAVDDSGIAPTVSYEVYDAAGEVPVVDGAFRVRSYDDHFIVVKAKDATGNINAELLRLTVDQDTLDPDGVFRYFGTTAAVSEKPGGAGIAVSTDRSIDHVYAQVRPVGEPTWADAPVRTSTNDRDFEVNTIGRDAPEYEDQITGQTLRSHEFDLRGLKTGVEYEYRVGAASGGAPSASTTDAWTAVLGEFIASGGENEPVYIVGDLQATSHDEAELGLLRDVVDVLKTKTPGGRTLIQTGDLVDNGGRGQYWDEVFDHVFDGLDIQVAPVVGNHETYGDLDYNTLSEERTAIFSNLFNLPKNGTIGESNYSFDRGDIHVSILNSNFDIDEQLAWLADDVRSSTATWNVVSGHFSYYGGQHGDDPGMGADRAKVTKVLDELGVDLYVGGHDHVYKRSTIFEGALAATPEQEALGTTFVTLGSAGPKFYDNVPHWWDDVTFDEDTQTGTVMEVDGDGLKVSTYSIDGRLVDTHTVVKPTGTWRMGSVDISDGELRGVGFQSYPGGRSTLTVSASIYDTTQEKLLDVRTENVTLRQSGAEQMVSFDTPMEVGPGDTVKVFVWDSLASGEPLVESVLVREGIGGGGTAEDPYLLTSPADFQKIDYDPAGYYLLANDVDFGGIEHTQIGATVRFTGVLDGGGNTISGFSAAPQVGGALFFDNRGTIRNLHVDADVTSTLSSVGILTDVNNGLIERNWVSGSITGLDAVGSFAGYSYGTIRDSYSTANVTATGLYAGGIAGVARGGSSTTEVYATGAVVSKTRTAGGIVSYGNEETLIEHTVALNSEVTAPSFAHAIVGRVGDGEEASLADNHVSAAVPVGLQSLSIAPAADNEKGRIERTATVRTAAFYESLGWDLSETWQWSADGRRPVLRTAVETVTPAGPDDQPSLPLDADKYYLVSTAAELAQLALFPAEDYRLTADLDLAATAPGIGTQAPFSGELDGAGHTIAGLTSTTGGLFGTMNGWVHDLAITGATVSKTGERAGILADQNGGTIERVYTSGGITGDQRTGGIVGDSFGIIRDSYSTASVSGTDNRYSGGIAGITQAGSTTERVYATGSVTSIADRSVAGISGYAYAGTVIRDSIALNSAVTGLSYAQRVVSRVGGDNVSLATLTNNSAVESLVPTVQLLPAVGPATLNGQTRTVAEVRLQSTFETSLKWDFGSTWQWSAVGKRPVLQSVVEDVPAPPSGPALVRASDGAYLIKVVADFAELTAFPAERFRLTSDLSLAGSKVVGIGAAVPFTGELDGGGFDLTGFTSTTGGLFATIGVGGHVHDLGIPGAVVSKATGNAGILADTNRGAIDHVYTTGSVKALTTAGGIVGTLWSTITDSYSTASATATTTNYSGGIVGIAEANTTIDRVYASGASLGGTTAGGISGYARSGTTVIQNSFAIGSTVTATSFGQRVLARAATGQTATLLNNSAIQTMVAEVQSVRATGATTLNGQTRTAADTRLQSTWQTGLGWNFSSTWKWDTALARPVLQSTVESASSSEAVRGAAAPGESGTASDEGSVGSDGRK